MLVGRPPGAFHLEWYPQLVLGWHGKNSQAAVADGERNGALLSGTGSCGLHGTHARHLDDSDFSPEVSLIHLAISSRECL